jgi:hypothetical protein
MLKEPRLRSGFVKNPDGYCALRYLQSQFRVRDTDRISAAPGSQAHEQFDTELDVTKPEMEPVSRTATHLVARKPANFEWLGFSEEQIRILALIGNNGWSRNGQFEALMPTLLDDLARL